MDRTETHYISIDPDQIWRDMMIAYMEAGGDTLYPGDEKEMLLRTMVAGIVQAQAQVDNALRMDTLRYAMGEYLDIYGEKRGCVRHKAAAAKAQVVIQFASSGKGGVIAAGETVTADGEVLYTLDADVPYSGLAQTAQVGVTCTQAGAFGNGLLQGMQLQFLSGGNAVESVYCLMDASGGEETETDEAYRERIRNFGLANVTTGPTALYESMAMAVSGEIIDVHAAMIAPGTVGVYLLPASETGTAALMSAVQAALSADKVRPLTDHVVVGTATPVTYTLNVRYSAPQDSSTRAALEEAVESYKGWQERKVGRAFNPEILMAKLYSAGATRVIWAEGSGIGDAPDGVGYHEIAEHEYLSGEISLAVIG